jgi:glycosyltransferase involved in cell wall biosynthesis
MNAGWRVVVFGFEGSSPRMAEWNFVRLPMDKVPYAGVFFIFLRAMRRVGLAIARWGCFPYIKFAGAKIYHSSIPQWRWIRKEIKEFSSDRKDMAPDLVISHDYFTADVGYRSAKKFKAKFVIDCHEYARGQFMHDQKWVKFMQPYVIAFQDHYLARAHAVTTVCDGIAELLNKEQKLQRPVEVIRSVPFLNAQPFRPTGNTIRVLYHGEIHYIRGIHKAIKSMRLWRKEFELVLRGNCSAEYLEYLKNLAEECGVAHRVHFEKAVAFDQIIPAANQADIGYFVHKDLSPQKRFVLPNKYFEYVMAGIALCVSDLPEMARLLKQYEFGKLVSDYSEEEIAKTINSFNRENIDAMKKASLRAATELNWEREQKRMLKLYEEILG